MMQPDPDPLYVDDKYYPESDRPMMDIKRRRGPIPTEWLLFVWWHRLRGHRVEKSGYYLMRNVFGRHSTGRCWHCLTCHATWPW